VHRCLGIRRANRARGNDEASADRQAAQATQAGDREAAQVVGKSTTMIDKMWRVVGRDADGAPILKLGARIFYHDAVTADGSMHRWHWYRRIKGVMRRTAVCTDFPAATYAAMKHEADRIAEKAKHEEKS
jgi:hypothetical protein